MKFSIIYSLDIPKTQSVGYFQPPKHKKLWKLTEQNDHDGDYAYAGLPKHRKYCAILTRSQFDEFVDHCGLEAEDVETMGSLGAPGFLGLAPAISFNGTDTEAVQNAYVTPIPDCFDNKNCKHEYDEEIWKRIRNAMINTYS